MYTPIEQPAHQVKSFALSLPFFDIFAAISIAAIAAASAAIAAGACGSASGSGKAAGAGAGAGAGAATVVEVRRARVRRVVKGFMVEIYGVLVGVMCIDIGPLFGLKCLGRMDILADISL